MTNGLSAKFKMILRLTTLLLITTYQTILSFSAS